MQNLWFINAFFNPVYIMLNAGVERSLIRSKVGYFDVLSPLKSSDLESVTVIFSFTSHTPSHRASAVPFQRAGYFGSKPHTENTSTPDHTAGVV